MPKEDDIIQRIILSGDQEMIAQLQNIAKSGQKAFKDIEDAANKASSGGAFQAINAAGASVITGFKALSSAGAEIVGAFAKIESQVLKTAKGIGIFTVGLGGVIALFKKVSSGSADASDNIAKGSEALSLSTEEFQKLRIAANQAGISNDEFDTSMSRLIRSIDAVNDAQKAFEKGRRAALHEFQQTGDIDAFNKKLADLRFELTQAENPFKDLNVQIARNRDGSASVRGTIANLADGFKKTGVNAESSAAGLQIFGRGAIRMIPFLAQGNEELDKQGETFKKLGLIVTGDVLKRQEKLNDSYDLLGNAVSAFRQKVTAAFAPTTVILIDKIVEALGKFQDRAVQAASSIVSSLIPVIDDLIKLIEGKGSEIDKTSVVAQTRDAVLATAKGIDVAVNQIIIPAIKGLVAALEPVAKAINAVFGTELTGGAVLVIAIILKVVGVFTLLGTIITSTISIVTALVGVLGGAVPAAIAALAFLIGFTLVKALLAVDWKGIATAAQDAFNAIVQFGSDLISGLQNIFSLIVAGGVALWDQIVQQALGAVNIIVTGWNVLSNFFVNLWESIKTLAQAAWTFVSDQAQIAVDFILGIFNGLTAGIVLAFTKVKDFIISVWNSVKDIIGQLGGGGANGAAQSFAQGGKVHGPGTGTSDSVPIWASAGEWIMKTAAVRKYGVNFMNAINSLRFDPAGFDVGGLVPFGGTRPQMRFAEGGLVPQRKNVLNLTIGDKTFQGLGATDDTMDDLTRFATSRQVRSAGRKPGWHGG